MTTFLQGATAWAGSDKALADDEVEQSKNVCAKGTAFDVPVYVSPIAVVFNLKGVSDQGKHVNMDASTIAKIFDGKITKWNDAAIKSQNPKLNLPDTDITVVHRSDKSGTTQNFVATSRTLPRTTGPMTCPRTGRTRSGRAPRAPPV